MTPRTSPARPLARAALTALFLFLPACSSDPLSQPDPWPTRPKWTSTLRQWP